MVINMKVIYELFLTGKKKMFFKELKKIEQIYPYNDGYQIQLTMRTGFCKISVFIKEE